MLPAIEKELKRIVARLDEPRTRLFHEMLTYHMGWSGEGCGPEAAGKRIRPLLVLLTCAASNRTPDKTGSEAGMWKHALPAAACIELIHNFSLVHDDIQDGSDLRRGRLTVWKKWGMPQAINAGDALFILAQMALLETKDTFPPEKALQAGAIINEACLALSSGQFLDISYEKRIDLADRRLLANDQRENCRFIISLHTGWGNLGRSRRGGPGELSQFRSLSRPGFPGAG